MSNPNEIPLEPNGEHVVEPPIVDSLFADQQKREWVIVFVPEDSVSTREKESVAIPFASSEGTRIQLRMTRLNRLLGGELSRILHGGDSNFVFHMNSGQIRELDQEHGQADLSLRAYVELADIAMTAQIEFLATHSVSS